jgi:inosine/xanthosine triphosphate pyrophosphatase family protein
MFKIVFLTSSRKKYAHLKFLAQKLSIDITLFHELTYHATYTEPRIYNRKQLIEESVNSAIEQINKAGVFSNTYFLIEDTSVIIHALSSQDKEIPGVDIKYWMQENKFANINKLLKGKDRSVTVQSDMILFTKNKEFYYHVTGYSQGHITKKEYQIQTHLLYPWLDNQTFNKWFVPSGEKLPMSMLNIDTATQKDFRNNAFCKLYRLLNKDKKIAQNITSGIQQNVFPSRVIIITGHTCAGKTTIAQYIAKKYNFLHLEASDYMHLKFYDIHGITTKYHIGEFAKIALKEQPEIVAKEIINTLNAYPNINGIIISGFRSPKEVNYLTKHLNNNYIFSYFNINAT